MPDGLVTPELVLEVAEAIEDYRVTAKEFNDIMAVVTSVFLGVAVAGFTGMLLAAIIEGFTRETGIKLRKEMGIPIPH